MSTSGGSSLYTTATPTFEKLEDLDPSFSGYRNQKPLALVTAEQERIRLPRNSKLNLKPPRPPCLHDDPDVVNNNTQHSACFGRSLSDQPMCEVSGFGQVPAILVACCDFLRSGHLEMEGLFRVEGSKVRVRDLRMRLETGCGIREGTPPHDVCSTLKAWLRELPEPLVPSRIALALAEVKESSEGSLQLRARAVSLRGLHISPGQLRALRYLCEFLGQVSRISSCNRMDAANLATCLGPSLLEYGRHTLSSVSSNHICPREVARLNGAVALLIEFPGELGQWAASMPHHASSSSASACERRRRSSGAIVGGALKAVGRAVSRLASRSRSRSPGACRAQQQQHKHNKSDSPTPFKKLIHRVSSGSSNYRCGSTVAPAPSGANSSAAAEDDRPPLPGSHCGKPPPPSHTTASRTPPPPLPPPLSTLPSVSLLRTPHPRSPATAAGPLRAVHSHNLSQASAAATTAAAAAACGSPMRSKDARRPNTLLASAS